MGGILAAEETIGAALNRLFFDFDYAAFSFFGSIHSDAMTLLAKIFTSMGSTVYVALFALMGLVLCFFRRTRRVGFSIVFAVLIGTLVTNIIVKPMVLRIRPYNTLQHIREYWQWYREAGMFSESDYSFPSGHTTGATELAMALCLCHATSKERKARRVAWVFPLIAVLVACSRVYLMVHYMTDVIAGLIVGALAGTAGFFLSRLVCSRLDRTEARPVSVKAARRGALCVALAWCVIFTVSFVMLSRSGGEEALRCAYDGEYDCQNEAQTGDDYPPIDGKYYCKIHWNELMGEEAA